MRTQLSLKRGTATHFSARIYCGQTAEWIKMPLGTDVGLGPGHIVLHGDPAPQRGTAPIFRPISIVAKRSPISATAEHLLKALFNISNSVTQQEYIGTD